MLKASAYVRLGRRQRRRDACTTTIVFNESLAPKCMWTRLSVCVCGVAYAVFKLWIYTIIETTTASVPPFATNFCVCACTGQPTESIFDMIDRRSPNTNTNIQQSIFALPNGLTDNRAWIQDTNARCTCTVDRGCARCSGNRDRTHSHDHVMIITALRSLIEVPILHVVPTSLLCALFLIAAWSVDLMHVMFCKLPGDCRCRRRVD